MRRFQAAGKRGALDARIVRRAMARPVSPIAAMLALLVSAFAAAMLALFQWMELLVLQGSGEIFCSLSSTVDCASVWNSDFAKTAESISRMPVAGWGLVWSLAATVIGLAVWARALRQQPLSPPLWAARLLGAVGVAFCVGLGGVSFYLGHVCLTCLGTYVLVAIFAGASFRLAPGATLFEAKAGPWVWAGASVAVAYGLLLYPAARTRVEPVPMTLPPPPKAEPVPQDDLTRFLRALPPNVQQSLSDVLAQMRASRPQETRDFPIRRKAGHSTAPVQLVDFSDILCGHCRHLQEALSVLEQEAPEGILSTESRFFPLDAECNPEMPKDRTDGTGTRCAGAKALICLEDKPGYAAARERMFAEQPTLNKARVLQIAQEYGKMDAKSLEQCMQAPQTAQKLADDIRYAMRYNLQGTPMVLVNGRLGSAMPPFLYAMVVAHGDPDAPGFKILPPPRNP